MNAFNRLIMLVLALLLIAVPMLLLLVAFGVITADLVDQYTNYRGAVGALEDFSPSSPRGLGVVLGIIGLLATLISAILLLRELTFGRRVARSVIMDDTPGKETTITAKAVRALAEGAAREAGAVSPTTSLTSVKQSYLVSCRVQAPENDNFTELASHTRENIRKVLEGQGVPVRDVEVTVQRSAS